MKQLLPQPWDSVAEQVQNWRARARHGYALIDFGRSWNWSPESKD